MKAQFINLTHNSVTGPGSEHNCFNKCNKNIPSFLPNLKRHEVKNKHYKLIHWNVYFFWKTSFISKVVLCVWLVCTWLIFVCLGSIWERGRQDFGLMNSLCLKGKQQSPKKIHFKPNSINSPESQSNHFKEKPAGHSGHREAMPWSVNSWKHRTHKRQ